MKTLTPPTPPDFEHRESHDLEWDPPGLSSVARWTCRRCGRAVLDYHGNVYGGATTAPCSGPIR